MEHPPFKQLKIEMNEAKMKFVYKRSHFIHTKGVNSSLRLLLK
jgi:hypothetical protein